LTGSAIKRDRPSLGEALSAAVVAFAVGAIVAWTAAPVAAAPSAVGAPVADPFAAVSTVGPAWIVSPRAARPGEVVHVRLKVATLDPAAAPVAFFAFQGDVRHPVQGRLYPAEGAFGVDLIVPPGTDWGRYPIVWATTQAGIAAVADPLAPVRARFPVIPFVATRSAQPPLWTR
jgi:hypothetical protein